MKKFVFLPFIIVFISINTLACSSDDLIDHLEQNPYDSFSDSTQMMTYIRDCFQNRRSMKAIFPAVYILVTDSIEYKATQTNFYLRPKWMERMVVEFFKLYREAVLNWEKQDFKKVPKTWRTAFRSADKQRPSAFKNLLLSIHAHIDRDLPIALHRLGVKLEECNYCISDYFKTNALFKEILPDLWHKLEDYDPQVNATDHTTEYYEDDIMKALISFRKRAWGLGLKMERSRFPYSEKKVDRKANKLTKYILLSPRRFNGTAVFALRGLF
jgi:hypothetical protein